MVSGKANFQHCADVGTELCISTIGRLGEGFWARGRWGRNVYSIGTGFRA